MVAVRAKVPAAATVALTPVHEATPAVMVAVNAVAVAADKVKPVEGDERTILPTWVMKTKASEE